MQIDIANFRDGFKERLKYYYPNIPSNQFNFIVDFICKNVFIDKNIGLRWYKGQKFRRIIIFRAVSNYIRHRETNYDEVIRSRSKNNRAPKARKKARKSVYNKIKRIRASWGENECMLEFDNKEAFCG